MARGIIRRRSIETVVQPKLKVGQPGDKYEQEADAMADRVVADNTPEPVAQMSPADEESVTMKPDEETVNMKSEDDQVVMSPEDEGQLSMKEDDGVSLMMDEEKVAAKEEDGVSMKEDEEVAKKEDGDEEGVAAKEEDVAMKEDEEKVAAKEEDLAMKEDEDQISAKEEEEVSKKDDEIKKKPAIQKSGDGNSYASPAVAQQIHQTKGQGSYMAKSTRNELGQKMGADFSKVKIHTDQNAAALNDSLGAKAFTHGNDIYFNKGNYDPGSSKGKHLLAHELTHTIQQKGNAQEKARMKGSPRKTTYKFGKLQISRLREVKFTSTAASPNVKIILHHRPIESMRCTISVFKTIIDGASRTDETITTSGDESKWKKTVLDYKMNHAMEHVFKIKVHDPCPGLGGPSKQLETYGEIIVY